MAVYVKYISDDTKYEFNCIENIKNPGNILYINCSNNNLTSLPENMNFPLLQEFNCSNNNLTSLPENMYFPQLKTFYCSYNQLVSLPENMSFPLLRVFKCTWNKLKSLSICIMNWRNLQNIYFGGNEIDLSPQLERFINRIQQGSVNEINVYDDTQNIHNSAIQGSVRDSINRLTTRRDLPKFDSAKLNTMILSDDMFLPTVKQQLIEYCQDESVHSLLLLKFSEVLWYVLNTITHDFSSKVSVQTEIKRVLNQEMQDAECKCFTDRMNRVVNCLNGFSPLVEVKISDSEQIGNVIVMLKVKALGTDGNYSVEVHKQLVTKELHERGYDSETVSQWFEKITNPENVIYIDCSKEFYCCGQLVELPKNMDKMFPQLTYFDCRCNRLVSLPANMNFPQLTHFYCGNNNLVSLPENMNFHQLQVFDCGNNKLTSLPENMNFPHLTYFNCSGNKLKFLPENMNLPNLRIFWCTSNKLTSLPENMGKMFPALEDFCLNYNRLVSLPENMNLPLLQKFYCGHNKLASLPENMNFPQLQIFCCNDNNLTALSNNMNFPSLLRFNCSSNQLKSLPENMNFPSLQRFDCNSNQLVSLPVCIISWRNFQNIYYYENEIELSPQLERFLNRIQQSSVTKLNVYGDTQNVHNSAIQGSVRDSINRLTTRMDLPKIDSETLNTMILTDDVLLPTVKQQLIDYCQDESVHSLLLLTFAEVLWYVMNAITHDFSSKISVQNEIKRVLNQEMQDAECKCFTGRMNRVVNCLNGFSPLVEVKISDNEQIGNVIVMLRKKALDTNGNYSVEVHKQLVAKELRERGYNSETATQWLEYIE